jgi:hypothetical protein
VAMGGIKSLTGVSRKRCGGINEMGKDKTMRKSLSLSDINIKYLPCFMLSLNMATANYDDNRRLLLGFQVPLPKAYSFCHEE